MHVLLRIETDGLLRRAKVMDRPGAELAKQRRGIGGARGGCSRVDAHILQGKKRVSKILAAVTGCRTYSLHVHAFMEVVHDAVDTRLEIRPSTEVSICVTNTMPGQIHTFCRYHHDPGWRGSWSRVDVVVPWRLSCDASQRPSAARNRTRGASVTLAVVLGWIHGSTGDFGASKTRPAAQQSSLRCEKMKRDAVRAARYDVVWRSG